MRILIILILKILGIFSINLYKTVKLKKKNITLLGTHLRCNIEQHIGCFMKLIWKSVYRMVATMHINFRTIIPWQIKKTFLNWYVSSLLNKINQYALLIVSLCILFWWRMSISVDKSDDIYLFFCPKAYGKRQSEYNKTREIERFKRVMGF